jgi:spermidine synthase
MKPQILLAEAKTPDGARLTLHAHDNRYSIRVNGKELMNSATTASELSLGELAVEGLETSAAPRILIGGLGFGYTLQGVLSKVGKHATVHVTELIPAVLEWNRTHLAELNGALLTDPRVKILTEDVRSVIARSSNQPYDAIALDIDNGPSAMVQSGNAKVYDLRGIQRIAQALKPGGRVTIWSSGGDKSFESRLSNSGFTVKAIPSKKHTTAKSTSYMIYVADKNIVPAAAPAIAETPVG